MKLRFPLSLLLLVLSPISFAGYDDYQAIYEKPVNLPNCDTSKPDVRVISSNSDWSDINNSKYRIFCVEPGDYTGRGEINITQSGSSSSKRFLIYHSSNDSGQSPWKMAAGDRAKVNALTFNGAGWWVVDRITVTNPNYRISGKKLLDTVNKANNIVFNRVLLEKNNDALLRITEGARDITLQNSVLRYTRLNNNKIYNCIYIAARDAAGSTVRPHIVNNEIYDCPVDGVQINSVTKKTGPKVGFDGMVFENNDIYITPDLYTDGKGNLNKNGPYACAENAIDIKITRVKPGEEMTRVIHNRLWGYRSAEPDTGICDPNGSPAAPAIAIHHTYTDYILVKDNIIMDSENGIYIAKPGPNNLSFVGNLFYDVANKINPRGAMIFQRGNNIEAYFNVVVNSKTYLEGGASKVDMRNNTFVNAGNWKTPDFSSSGSSVRNNAYFNTKPYNGNADRGNNLVKAAASDSRNTQFCFKRKLLTNPERICVPNVIPSANSPETGTFDNNVGSASGFGIDDAKVAYKPMWGDGGQPGVTVPSGVSVGVDPSGQ